MGEAEGIGQADSGKEKIILPFLHQDPKEFFSKTQRRTHPLSPPGGWPGSVPQLPAPMTAIPLLSRSMDQDSASEGVSSGASSASWPFPSSSAPPGGHGHHSFSDSRSMSLTPWVLRPLRRISPHRRRMIFPRSVMSITSSWSVICWVPTSLPCELRS